MTFSSASAQHDPEVASLDNAVDDSTILTVTPELNVGAFRFIATAFRTTLKIVLWS
jgi:hypothetical protein